MSRLTRFEEIHDNWEYERAIKPEDVDYLLERVEELKELSYRYRRKLKNIRLMCASVDAYDKETIPAIYEEVNRLFRGESE